MRFRRQRAYNAGVIALVVIAGGLWFGRGVIREEVYDWTRPAVPPAAPYVPSAEAATTTTNPARNTTPTAGTTSLPSQLNLAVPFLLQAPKQNWVDPFEDACEEASLLMVDGYYKARKIGWTPDQGVKDILDVVAFEDQAYGYNKDTTANDVAHTAQAYFHYPSASVIDATEANIKKMLAQGYPVIAPAYGKALLNPNFRNGGPQYHMLVIKGYNKDGSWITNDPGTRNGKDYVYPKQRLLDAIHDFNATDMKLGRKVVIVVTPK